MTYVRSIVFSWFILFISFPAFTKNSPVNWFYHFSQTQKTTQSDATVSSPDKAVQSGCESNTATWREGFVTPVSAQLEFGVQQGFNYFLEWRQQGVATWSSRSFATVTYNGSAVHTIYNLTPNRVYEWRVTTTCPDGTATVPTTTRLFTAQCTTPSSLFVPTISSTGAQVGWSADSQQPYRVRWRVAGSTEPWIDGAISTGFSYQITGLTTNTPYEWQVQMVCNGQGTPFSDSQTFTTACSTPSGYNLSVNPTQATVAWSGPLGGTQYEVQWRPQSSSDWPNSLTVSSTSASLTGLVSASSYDWQVRKLCTDGQASPFSARLSFTTPVSTSTTGCPIPANLGPIDLTATSAILRWDASSSVSAVVFQWKPQSSPDWPNSLTTIGNSSSLTGLMGNTAYQWRVQSICGSSTSTFSQTQSFTTTSCQPPTGMREYFFSATSVQLSSIWRTGNRYSVDYRLQGATTWTNSGTLSVGVYFPPSLSASTGYEWQMQTLCSDGSDSNFSSIRQFTTPAPCSVFVTLKDGNWSDPAVWSCGFSPTGNAQVIVRHRLSVPSFNYAYAGKLIFEENGTLFLDGSSRMIFTP